MSNTFAMIMKCFNSIDLIFNILKKSKKISKSFKKTGDNLLMCIFRVTQTMMKILCVCMCVCVCVFGFGNRREKLLQKYEICASQQL